MIIFSGFIRCSVIIKILIVPILIKCSCCWTLTKPQPWFIYNVMTFFPKDDIFHICHEWKKEFLKSQPSVLQIDPILEGKGLPAFYLSYKIGTSFYVLLEMIPSLYILVFSTTAQINLEVVWLFCEIDLISEEKNILMDLTVLLFNCQSGSHLTVFASICVFLLILQWLHQTHGLWKSCVLLRKKLSGHRC